MVCALIADGYVLSHTLPAQGRTPAITFRYRPAFGEAVSEHLHQSTRAQSGKERWRAVVDLLGKHLVSWDVANAEGTESVPITPDSLKRLPHRTASAIVDVVTGYSDEAQSTDLGN